MITRNDTEAISAYLDGKLGPRDRERLEARLKQDPALQAELDALDRTRALLRAAPRFRAPRDFTLTPELAGVQAVKPGFMFGLSRVAFTLTTILFAVALVGNYSFRGFDGLPPAEPAAVSEEMDMAMATSEVPASEDALRESGPAEIIPMEAMETQSVESGEDPGSGGGESFDPGTEMPSNAMEESQPVDPVAEGDVTAEAVESMPALEQAAEEAVAEGPEPEIASAPADDDGTAFASAPEDEPRINPWSIFAVLTGAAALLSGGLTLALRRK